MQLNEFLTKDDCQQHEQSNKTGDEQISKERIIEALELSELPDESYETIIRDIDSFCDLIVDYCITSKIESSE